MLTSATPQHRPARSRADAGAVKRRVAARVGGARGETDGSAFAASDSTHFLACGTAYRVFNILNTKDIMRSSAHFLTGNMFRRGQAKCTGPRCRESKKITRAMFCATCTGVR